MNDTDRQSLQITPSSGSKKELCDICLKKDEEDIYIIFNILYRVIVDEIFYEARKNDELSYDLDVINNTIHQERPKDAMQEIKKSEEKIENFKNAVSGNMLIEIIVSSQFDHLLKEIFKQKYLSLEHQDCQHEALARFIVESFGLENHKNDDQKEKTLANIERLDSLYSSIKQLKSDMDSSYTEINELCNHIVTKVFNTHLDDLRKDLNEEESKFDCGENGENGENGSNENGNDSSDKTKSLSGNGSGNGNSHPSTNRGASITISSRSNHSNGNNGNSSTDAIGSNDSSNENGNGNGNGTSDKSDDNKGVQKSKGKHLAFKSKLPKKSTDILKTWFLNNIQNPYPSHEAKEMLSKMTGLSKKQIQNWFTNSRKRFLEPLKKKIEKEEDSRAGEERQNQFNEETDDPEDKNRRELSATQQNNIQSNCLYNLDSQQNIRTSDSNQVFQQILNIPPQTQPQLQPQPPTQAQSQPQTQQQQIYTQPLFYQQMVPGSNVVILSPYMVQSTPMVYQYRTMPNTVQMNNTFVPIQQGNFIMAQSNFPGVSYVMPIQPNYVEYRGVVPHNMSTSYNTLNNNVFNNINSKGNIETNISYTELTPNGRNNQPEVWYQEENAQSEGSVSKNGSILHPKPDLDDAQYPINKHIHKDDEGY